MMKFLKSPLVRISFGLVMVTISVLLMSDLLGMVPDTRRAELGSRKVIVESLAVQLSAFIAENELHGVEDTLRAVVERNANVLSAGLRQDGGGLLVEFGGHSEQWALQPGERSTTTQVQVPLFDDRGRRATVELRFVELGAIHAGLPWRNSFIGVIVLVAVSGFIGYLLFLKRAMRELDPSAVIPHRVRKALDTLTEGLLIVDRRGVIVFSNQSFARKTGLTARDLVGKQSATLPWVLAKDDRLPWFDLLEGGELSGNATVKLASDPKTASTFTVNASTIGSAEGEIRGALVTFDDVTEIERKNAELKRTLGKLEESQREVTRQNQELTVLATRDPLTDLLNRRSFLQGFEALLAEARDEGEALSCIMVDIDHFKLVNDRFGHAVGDKVIKMLAKVLTQSSRASDLVGRLGGEEFCVVLPGVGREVGADIAERMRVTVQEGRGAKSANAMRITSSFGVSDLSDGAATAAELVDQADKALYAAKEGGRNRVVCWSSELVGVVTEETSRAPGDDLDSALIQEQSDQQAGVAAEDRPQPEGTSDVSEHSTDNVVALNPRRRDQDRKNEHLEHGNPQSSGLTSDASRIVLFDRIGQAINRSKRYHTQIALMIIDIEALQLVNDTMGYSVGEKFAKTVMSRLKRVLRGTDSVSLMEQNDLAFSVSSLGGNEIVVLLTDLKQTEILTVIIQRLMSATLGPIEVESVEYYLDTDIGVSTYPNDGEDADTLLRHASSAMREAGKHPGRNSFQFYAADINRRSKHRLRLEADMHRALDLGELAVYYQPKVDLKSGRILGLEALLRWHHPQLGMVPPDEFIPLAEQSGLIDRISQQVITTACQQIVSWRNAGYGTLTVAVNLSPVEFRNPHLAERILNHVSEAGIPTTALEVEITETVVMQNMDTAIDILRTLHEAGVGIAVDDFGTGYSSLSYLRKFPLSKVKIDRSFVSDFVHSDNEAALVSAIIAMAHSLGLLVVAEGVETDEQLRFLQDMGCDEIQGYLVSKPLPRDEVSELLSRSAGIERMIRDYGAGFAQVTAERMGTGTFGILNEFPTPVQDKTQLEALRVGEG
jgi:diguanylate cyclase (GGDEF)-like protein/PAS domain S-box-containing protein